MEGELNMAKEGKTGVTANTPQNILFGAGTIHKNLKFLDGSWNFAKSIMGATSGGSKLSIIPEVQKIEVDGALVRMLSGEVAWTNVCIELGNGEHDIRWV